MPADAVPRWAHLDDVNMAVHDVGLDLDLVPQVLRHTLPRPEPDAVEIGLGQSHQASLPPRRESHPQAARTPLPSIE
nr:hypothetical protein DA06_10210 [Georgenia sp. SUBG003]